MDDVQLRIDLPRMNSEGSGQAAFAARNNSFSTDIGKQKQDQLKFEYFSRLAFRVSLPDTFL